MLALAQLNRNVRGYVGGDACLVFGPGAYEQISQARPVANESFVGIITSALKTGERIACMLNPEDLIVRRLAGVRPRRSAGGPLTGAGLADDALLFTGGGTTELHLNLLFDVSLASSSAKITDVRDLTYPLWQLAENAADEQNYGSKRHLPGGLVNGQDFRNHHYSNRHLENGCQGTC
jgi:hypothetical protein